MVISGPVWNISGFVFKLRKGISKTEATDNSVPKISVIERKKTDSIF